MGMQGTEVAAAPESAAYRERGGVDDQPQREDTVGARCDALMATITDAETLLERLGVKLEPVRTQRPQEVEKSIPQDSAPRSPIGDLLSQQTHRIYRLGRQIRVLIDELDV